MSDEGPITATPSKRRYLKRAGVLCIFLGMIFGAIDPSGMMPIGVAIIGGCMLLLGIISSPH